LWITAVYTVNAFLLWGGGYFSAHGAVDYSGGYVIHLAAGVSGFVFAAVIGPRLQRDREVDAPNNLLMVMVGAGLLWLGWNGFNGGDSYYAGADASAAVINTNLCTAVAVMVWIGWDYIFRDKPSLIGSVNGMITGLVAITPAAGFVNGYGAIVIGVVASTLVWMAIRFLSRAPMFRSWRRMIEPRRLQMTRAHTTRAEFQNCDTVWRKLPRNFALSASISDPVFPHRKCGLSRERFSVRHPHKRKRPCPSALLSATFNQIGCWSDYLRSCRWVCRRVGIRRAAERRNRSPRYLRQTRPHALYPPE